MKKASSKRTTVGAIDADVLAYTAGRDVELDQALVEADCLGSAAHVTMLSQMPVKPRLISAAECERIIAELGRIMDQARKGRFSITLEDQDVHLAVERVLTEKLGDLGKKVHTGRSRNDQIAVDLRLHAKRELLGVIAESAALADSLLRLARAHLLTPMVGRTHLQPAMPSSVGLWASAFAEDLLDDVTLVVAAYEMNDQCPLGSAAGYGVPLPLDRELVSELLGFARPVHNVLYANNARGKVEAVILSALAQVMLTLSRLAQDLILFTLPEFNYFALPAGFCTGSSIMPQKRNPDVLELVRAKASTILSAWVCVAELVKGQPSGYHRDLQEAKEPFLRGLGTTRSSLRIMTRLIQGTTVNEKALLAAFTPEVFAADQALEMVAQGVPFRDAYHRVKGRLAELRGMDPREAIARKKHLGAPAGLDLGRLEARVREVMAFARDQEHDFNKAVKRLMGRA